MAFVVVGTHWDGGVAFPPSVSLLTGSPAWSAATEKQWGCRAALLLHPGLLPQTLPKGPRNKRAPRDPKKTFTSAQ